MKESENKEPSKTAGAARQGGNTNTEIIGSPVSTAVGEPVLTNEQIAQLNREAQDQSISGELPSVYLARAVEREVVARLAAPTQAKPVDLSGLTRYDIEHDGCGWMRDCIKGDYVKFADVESLLAAPTQVSVPQASAAQEVRAVPEGWRETLQTASEYIATTGEESGYGFWRPSNPHYFSPDAESCSPEEIAAHKAACEAYDKGEYTPERGSEWVGSMHVLRAPWGIGTYTTMDPNAVKLIAAIDSLLAAPTSTSTAPAGMDEAKFDDVAALWWDAAKGEAAMYVAAHCVDGEVHAEHIMEQKRPKFGSQTSLDEVTGAGKGEGDE